MQIVGMDITGTKALYRDDFVEIKVGRGIGSKGQIKQLLDGNIFVETTAGDMIETKARFVQFVDRPAQVMHG
jgi:hypothetical protein